MAEKMNLHQKLVEVRKSVPYLKKGAKGYQFDYVSSSQVLGTLRQKLDELNIILEPRVLKHVVEMHRTVNKDGKESVFFFTTLDMEFTWVDADNRDDKIPCLWAGQGIDQGEKGLGKAMTYGEKYFMLKFFNIATDKDDPDAFQTRTNGGAEAKKPAAAVQPAPKTNGMITAKQQSKIHAMMNELGWEREEMISVARERFGVESSKDLTVKQAGEIIDMLQENLDAIPPALKEAVGNG